MNKDQTKREILLVRKLNETIAIAAMTSYPEIESLIKARDYFAEQAGISTEYVTEKRKELASLLAAIENENGEPYFSTEYIYEKILGLKKQQ